jgi:hypothetical protein
LDLGWGKILVLMAWGFVVLAFAAGGLADVTRLWWLVLVFGAAVPGGALPPRAPEPKVAGGRGAPPGPRG